MKKNKYKIFSMIAAGTMLLASCDYNSQFEGLGESVAPNVLESFEYTLTDADYAEIAESMAKTTDSLQANNVKNHMAFNADAMAKNHVPTFLADKYFMMDNGSAVKLTYNFLGELPEQIQRISKGSLYTVSSSDYELAWGQAGTNFFTPSQSAEKSVPTILEKAIESPEEGDFAMVSYTESKEESAGTIIALDEDFSLFDALEAPQYVAEVEGWQNAITIGTWAWSGRTYSENGFIQSGAFNHTAGELETYMITPQFTARKDMKLSFDAAYRYFTTAGGRVTILLSENYVAGTDSASIAEAAKSATWTDISSNFSIAEPEDGGSNTLAAAGEMDLSAYSGKKINIAFRYNGNSDGKTSTAQIDNVLAMVEGEEGAVAPTTEAINALYRFDGTSWSAYKDAIAMCKRDFEAMGSIFDSFSTSMSPSEYLPTYLKEKFPYAKEEETISIAYKFFNTSDYTTSLMAVEYQYLEGVWSANNAISSMTDQFVLTGSKWFYNPSVTITLPIGKNQEISAIYYQPISDWVWENVDEANGVTEKGDGYVSRYGTNEYYYGSSAYQNNFDFRLDKWREVCPEVYGEMSDEELSALMWERLPESFIITLEALHADAKVIEGMDVLYTIIFGVYDGSATDIYQIAYKVIGDGEFEYVEGSIAPFAN